MNDPAEIDIIADRRVPYEDTFAFLGSDYTGSTFKMQVRQVKDTIGTAQLTGVSPTEIVIFYGGTDTVANHVAAGRVPGSGDDNIYETINPATDVNYVAGDSLALTILDIGFDTPGLSALPFPDEGGDDWEGWYDLIRTPVSGNREIVMRGTFTLRAGVTIP